MAIDQISINFSEDAIDVASASSLPAIGCGGECIFIGRTRPETNECHGELLALHYTSYLEMAEKELQTLAMEGINQFSVCFIRVTHAIGRVAINEASVVIAVSSSHRGEAFTACQFMIDSLKQRIPIWKQEEWAACTTWKEGSLLQQNE